MATKYTKWPLNFPNGSEINQLTIHKVYQHLSLQGNLEFTQIGIFDLKMSHLATQAMIGQSSPFSMTMTLKIVISFWHF
jgi:hypothetical protein